jgi:hypothetical protein
VYVCFCFSSSPSAVLEKSSRETDRLGGETGETAARRRWLGQVGMRGDHDYGGGGEGRRREGRHGCYGGQNILSQYQNKYHEKLNTFNFDQIYIRNY